MEKEKVADNFKDMRKKAIEHINQSKAAILITVNPNRKIPVQSLLISNDPVEFPDYMFSLMFGMLDLMTGFVSPIADVDISDHSNGRR